MPFDILTGKYSHYVQVRELDGKILRFFKNSNPDEVAGMPDIHEVSLDQIDKAGSDSKWDGSKIVPKTKEEIDADHAEEEQRKKAYWDSRKKGLEKIQAATGLTDDEMDIVFGGIM